MKTKLFSLLFSILLSTLSFGYNNLRVTNPHTWSSYNGVINDAEIAVRPVGAYVEYELTLTFSAFEPYWDVADAQLEVVLDFDLPQNSMITDSWLWINDVAKRADILDRWTASNIYEEIVSRRRDPSLLVKNGPNQYSINIYPMKPAESRKIKLVYLSPAKYSGNNLMVEIPANLLNLSAKQLVGITAYIQPSTFFGNPSSDQASLSFQTFVHPQLGNCKKVVIPNALFKNHNIELASSDVNKVKLYKYGNNDEGFYQLSFVPSELIDQTESAKKICYLIDFDANFYDGKKADLLTKLSKNIEGSINDGDQFNIIFSAISLKPSFTTWTSGSSINIKSAFANSQLSTYSNLVSLIAEGISFVNENGGDGKIILISDNNDHLAFSSANDVIADIEKINIKKVPINIIDYTTKNYTYYWNNNTYYYGNSYLFNNLARTSSGECIQFIEKLNTYDFDLLLGEAFNQVSGEILSNIDVYTDNQNGFCYGRMNVSGNSSGSFVQDKTIYQLGKYKGGFPTSLEISYEMNDNLQHAKVDLSTLPIADGDSIIQTIWSGIDIFQLEKQTNNTQIINEIIFQSVENRILSYYTAFLCVEDSIDLNGDGEYNRDDQIATKADEKTIKQQVKAYPNPFTTSIQIDLPSKEGLTELKIYNTTGQCVKTFQIEEDNFSYEWDGYADNGDLQKAGIYLIVANYSKKVVTLKIIKK